MVDAMARILIVDDDPDFGECAAAFAAQQGCEVILAPTLAQAREALAQRMDLILLDLHLPDGSGLDLLQDIDLAQQGRIVVLTGHPCLDSARRAVSEPIVEYLLKPLPAERLIAMFAHAAENAHNIASDQQLMRTGLLGRSRPLREVVATLLRIAPTDASVLLTGESGTGKELAAKTLHEASGNRGAFVALNCGAVPAELLASQLFGHERGSFTGAMNRHIGVFEQAEHGTLFLDEIAEMPPQLQVYLLRVLETGCITRVGGSDDIRVPVRVVAATNRDPLEAVAEGRLREDLYYRLADIAIHMPPLRDRDDDVLLLARAFIDRLNARYGQRKRLAPGCERTLLRHLWPGNVRELRSAVQRAYLLEPGNQVMVGPASAQQAVLRETDTSIVFSVGTTMADMERRMLLKTLSHFDNDKTAAARALGISVRTVHNHLARIAAEEGRPGCDQTMA
ncbi:sigma-54-dependent Fis family transcriptional regulator [Thermomonas fusca]|uniref:Sigma-54-dependent Fis family transcriptional regulator n=2 Tax=Thermomonas fusca TaxID=215690 RepID=A0A5R9PFI9_9GAMM|nr:sigma-54-dependent Fis family transcriptional regulator [Thermomonas fusca]